MSKTQLTHKEDSDYKKLTDYPKNTENPFVKKMIEEVDPVRRRKLVAPTNKEVTRAIIDTNTGELSGHTAFMQYIEVDETQFAKLYLSNIAAFWDLTPGAIRVFTYILQSVKPNQDKFYFVLEDCLEFTKYKSKKQIFAGLAILCEKQIIARGRTHFEYFINPMVIFNGNRITFAKTYIRKKIKDADQSQLDLFGNPDNKGLKALKHIADKNNLLGDDAQEEQPE